MSLVNNDIEGPKMFKNSFLLRTFSCIVRNNKHYDNTLSDLNLLFDQTNTYKNNNDF